MRKRNPDGTARLLSKADFNVNAEVDYIVARAVERDGRVVTLSTLLFFSTESGDAWALDTDDRLAVCLACDGTPVPIQIEETADNFAIEWTHTYQIHRNSMTFVDYLGHATTQVGYPGKAIKRAVRRMQRRGQL